LLSIYMSRAKNEQSVSSNTAQRFAPV